jgi:hypothetical protein
MSEAQDVAQVAEQDAQEIANQNQEAETPESAQAQAEAPETETEADQEVSTQTAKTFTQEQVDAIAAKERAKAERKAERKAAQAYEAKLEELTRQSQQPQRQEAKAEGKPKLEDFEKVEDYVEAVADWKLQAHQQKQAQQAEEQRARQTHSEVQTKAQAVFEMAEQDPEFDMAEFESLPISDPMAYAIMDSDIAPKVMVHLQKNPDEVDRIAKLSPARQAAEIGKLEAKLSVVEKVKPSSAPAPIKPVGSRGGATSGNPAEMTQAQYEAWRAKQGATWARR